MGLFTDMTTDDGLVHNVAFSEPSKLISIPLTRRQQYYKTAKLTGQTPANYTQREIAGIPGEVTNFDKVLEQILNDKASVVAANVKPAAAIAERFTQTPSTSTSSYTTELPSTEHPTRILPPLEFEKVKRGLHFSPESGMESGYATLPTQTTESPALETLKTPSSEVVKSPQTETVKQAEPTQSPINIDRAVLRTTLDSGLLSSRVKHIGEKALKSNNEKQISNATKIIETELNIMQLDAKHKYIKEKSPEIKEKIDKIEDVKTKIDDIKKSPAVEEYNIEDGDKLDYINDVLEEMDETGREPTDRKKFKDYYKYLNEKHIKVEIPRHVDRKIYEYKEDFSKLIRKEKAGHKLTASERTEKSEYGKFLNLFGLVALKKKPKTGEGPMATMAIQAAKWLGSAIAPTIAKKATDFISGHRSKKDIIQAEIDDPNTSSRRRRRLYKDLALITE